MNIKFDVAAVIGEDAAAFNALDDSGLDQGRQVRMDGLPGEVTVPLPAMGLRFQAPWAQAPGEAFRSSQNQGRPLARPCRFSWHERRHLQRSPGFRCGPSIYSSVQSLPIVVVAATSMGIATKEHAPSADHRLRTRDGVMPSRGLDVKDYIKPPSVQLASASMGGHEQTRLRSPATLSTRETGGQYFAAQSMLPAGKAACARE